MIVIGGAGSVGGAAAGALFVTALPLVLNHYSGSLPLLAEPGTGGVGASEFSRFIYGAAIVAVLLFARTASQGSFALERRGSHEQWSRTRDGRARARGRRLRGRAAAEERRRRRRRRQRGQDRPGRDRGHDHARLPPRPDSGVFAPNGKAQMEGANLYWDAKNEAGGICGRQIEVKVQDTGYDPQKAVAAYQQLSGYVIGLGLVLGSSIVSALLPSVEQDGMFLNFAGWTSDILPDRERRDRRHDVRHRVDQRRRLPDERARRQGRRHRRAPVLRGRLRRERAEGLEVRGGQAPAEDRRAEDHAGRPGHDRPGRRRSRRPA